VLEGDRKEWPTVPMNPATGSPHSPPTRRTHQDGRCSQTDDMVSASVEGEKQDLSVFTTELASVKRV